MNASKANPPTQLPIAISVPELWRLDFERRHDAPPSGEAEVSLATGLGLSRTGEDEIGVEFTVAIKEGAPFSIEVVYRARFQVSAEGLGPIEDVLRTIAGRIAPSTLYPFARETIYSTLAKAGIQAPVLPVMNFGSLFNLDEIELPPHAP